MADPLIELHARTQGDRPTLEALRAALEDSAVRIHLAGEPGAGAGAPGPCDLRVLIARPGAVAPAAPAGCRVAVLDQLSVPADPASIPDLTSADLILVPGARHARELGRLVEARIEACGLPRLEAARLDPAGTRDRARRMIGIPLGARVVACEPAAAPGADPVVLEILQLAARGPLVLLLPGTAPATWLDAQRGLAARTPGLALVEHVDPHVAVAAADVVYAADPGLRAEAALLGRAQIPLDCAPTAEAIGEALAGGPPAPPADLADWLATSSGAAAAMAATILQALPAASDGAARPAATGSGSSPPATSTARADRAEGDPAPADPASPATLEDIDALIAFGDHGAAREALRRRIGEGPAPELRRRLAALERREGRLEAAASEIAAAETEARCELSAVLAERARIAVETGRLEDAPALFEQAHRTDPGRAEPLVGLGSLALTRGDGAAAEQHFRRALECEKSPRTLTGMGLSMHVLGRPREAVDCFEQALDIEVDYLSAVAGLVQSAYASGELAAAERRVAAYVELHMADLDMGFTLAGLRCELGDASGALQILDGIALFDASYPGLAELRDKLTGAV